MKRLLSVALMGLTLFGCSEPSIQPEDEAVNNPVIENPHRISEEQAIQNLMEFLKEMDGELTKSGADCSSREIKDIYPIKSSRLDTKITAGKNVEDIVFIANFKDSLGFAILSADDRIPTDIIAVTEEGNITADELYQAYNSGARDIYPQFPLDGPGVITDADGEKYLNPNTFQLYDPESDDSLVGDFIGHEDYEVERVINDNIESIDQESTSRKRELAQHCLDYATRTLGSQNLGDPADGRTMDSSVPQEGPEYDEIVRTETVLDKEKVFKLLTFAVGWDQYSPFNDNYPMVRQMIFGAKKKAAAGCVPLAIAKIMAHFEYPTEVNGEVFSWKALKLGILAADYNTSAAKLLKYIAESCNSWYFYGGTFTFPKKAGKFLAKEFSVDVDLVKYSTDEVTKMLDNDCPVFICSIPSTSSSKYALRKSHGWNIDGYKIRTKTITRDFYKDGVLKNQDVDKIKTTLVHCDFGWGGSCNGYFVSGVFDLNDSNVEYDQSSDKINHEDYNYRWYLRILKYEKPY